MLTHIKKYRIVFALLAVCIITAGCKNLQASYDAQAYRQAVSLKVEAMQLMDEATTSYDSYTEDVADLKTELNKAYEYAKGLDQNDETTRQWQIMKNPDRNLLGGFLQRWKDEGSLSDTFVDNAKKIVADSFDTIIELEKQKN